MNDYLQLNFKSRPILYNSFYVRWHDTLIELIEWYNDVFQETITVTSAYRPGDKGVHGTNPLRAIDIRGKGRKAKEKVTFINKYWQYDSRRPEYNVAIIHNVGRGEHIHLQVHDSSNIYRGGWENAWKQ